MAHNPLLGSRISLISKKNIRYEGTLYSINEADATVALQNVLTFGTEGREGSGGGHVPPQDVVHPYLLFRGCDIKDLHVHEGGTPPTSETVESSKAATATTSTNASRETSKVASTSASTSASELEPNDDNDTCIHQGEGQGSDDDDNNTPDPTKVTEPSKGTTAATSPSPKESATGERGVTDSTQGKKDCDHGSPPLKEEYNDADPVDGQVGEHREKEQQDAGRGSGGGRRDQERSNGFQSHQHNQQQQHHTWQQPLPTGRRRRRGRGRNGGGGVEGEGGRGGPDHSNSRMMVGTGASLLRRKARGAVFCDDRNDAIAKSDFDFASSNADFRSDRKSDEPNLPSINDGDDHRPPPSSSTIYNKDDFFDSISCDVTDRQNGLDNRLRGAEERNLNTETFGAVSLGNGRRGGRRNRGRGRRGGGAMGGGGRGGRFEQGRRDGSGRGEAPRPRENGRWRQEGGGAGIRRGREGRTGGAEVEQFRAVEVGRV